MAEALTAASPRASALKPESRRNLSEMLALWAVCPRAACRKAGGCRGRNADCLPRDAEKVPLAARLFVLTLFSGKEDGLAYDDALARIPDELAADYAAWHATVAALHGRRRRRAGAVSVARIERSEIRGRFGG
jgi:hypothetical protein